MIEHLEQIKATLNAVGIECDIIDADGKHVLACSKEVDGIKRSMRYKCSTCLGRMTIAAAVARINAMLSYV